MTRYYGNDWVKTGYYWNSSQWEVITISKEGGVLPGGSDLCYVRIPALMLMFLAPLLGGLFVIFFPFIGFGVLLELVVKKLISLMGIMKERLMGIMKEREV